MVAFEHQLVFTKLTYQGKRVNSVWVHFLVFEKFPDLFNRISGFPSAQQLLYFKP